MNKERLEWVMSGLNQPFDVPRSKARGLAPSKYQHALTKTEDQFVKTAVEDFEEKHALTELQEERLEGLYKEKSKLIPNKHSSNYFSFRESSPQKGGPRKSRAKMVF